MRAAAPAVEPTAAFRSQGMALHPSPRIVWLSDSLPGLERTLRLGREFDLVLLTAVWMHLDEVERRLAMANLATLLAAKGLLAMSVRRGPVPPGRLMFDVPSEETVALAENCGLRPTRA